MFAIHPRIAPHVFSGSRQLILCLVRPMQRFHARGILVFAAVLCLAPFLAAAAVRSDAELRRLLVGKWHESDSIFPHRGAFGPGFDRLPHRMELTLSADGTCVYRVIPRQPGWPASVTHGRWSVRGTLLTFHWTAAGAVYAKPLDSGRITLPADGQFDITTEHIRGTRSFFRSRKKSQTKIP